MAEYDYFDHDTQDTTGTRFCFVCLKPVRTMSKASVLSAGMGLKIVAHPECLQSISDAKTELVQKANEKAERDRVAASVASEVRAGNLALLKAIIETAQENGEF